MTDNALTAAVTVMNANPDYPGSGLAESRCQVETANFDGCIIGLSYDPLDPGLYLKDYCESGYLLSYPSAGDDAFMERLSSIHDREHIDILLPCLDAELPGVIRLKPEIEKMVIKIFPPNAEQLHLRDKDESPEVGNIPVLYTQKSGTLH